MSSKILDLYTDYLISSFTQTTATGLSRMLGGALTHDVFTNFLAEEEFTSPDLWKLVKKDVRKVESLEACILIDDMIQEKPHTDENEIICYHFDHTQGRSVKGINLLNCLYYSQEVSLPLCFEIIRKEEEFIDPKDGKRKRRSSLTKNELMQKMLRSVQQYQIPFRYVLADVWYASSENMKFIKKKLKKDFLMTMKSNRLAALSKEDKLQGRFVNISSLPFRNDDPLTVYIKGLDFPVLLHKQVFTNKDASEGILYLVCSDLSLNADQLQTIYQKRWKVEEFHKSIKQNTSFAKSPTRVPTTQSNHCFASIYAFVKLERLKFDTKLNHFALKSRLYMNALKASFEELNRMNAQLAS